MRTETEQERHNEAQMGSISCSAQRKLRTGKSERDTGKYAQFKTGKEAM
jgi:hypothetical protein